MTSRATSDPALGPLRQALDGRWERDPQDYPVEGVTPRAAFAPEGRAEVAALLGAATGAGLVVVPQAGRTALALGAPLQAYDVALDLRGLSRVVEYVPDDLTVTVEAGMTLGALQAELGAHGQHLPIDPSPDDSVSIGGMLATARSGAWRGHFPAARDLVLGIEAAQPSGALVKSGGRVVKNVTGYDLHRMHTGALGAFGVIVEATFKVAPLPVSTRTMAARADSLADAARLAQRAWDASLSTRAITLLAPEPAAHVGLPSATAVLVDLAGSNASVERSAAELVALGAFQEAPPEAWAYLRRLQGEQAATVLRMGVPPSAIAEFIEAGRAAGALAWGHLASGAVICHADALDATVIAGLRAQAEARGGFLQVESAPVAVRRAVGAGGAGDGVLVAALRDRFDPSRILNRGRWPEPARAGGDA